MSIDWTDQEWQEFREGFYERDLFDTMRQKHKSLNQNFGSVNQVDYCVGCKTPQGVLNVTWPCDVIKVLDALEQTPPDHATMDQYLRSSNKGEP